MDLRTLQPKPYVLYFPGKIEQSQVSIRAHLSWSDSPIGAPPLPNSEPFGGQKSYDSQQFVHKSDLGPTRKAPLGKVVLARSGDKGGNANIGLWVRNDDEWPWLRSLLSISKIKELLGNDYKPEYRVERFEVPALRAVHFVVYGILEDGVSSSSLIDGFAKSVGEFVRARQVDIPTKFLERPEVGATL